MDQTEPGSNLPFFIISSIIFLLWLYYSNGDFPKKARKRYQIWRVTQRRRFGYRDETKYNMVAGSGSDMKLKRVG